MIVGLSERERLALLDLAQGMIDTGGMIVTGEGNFYELNPGQWRALRAVIPKLSVPKDSYSITRPEISVLAWIFQIRTSDLESGIDEFDEIFAAGGLRNMGVHTPSRVMGHFVEAPKPTRRVIPKTRRR